MCAGCTHTHTHPETHSYTTHRVVCLDKRRTQQAENGFPSKLSACHGQSQRHSQAAQQASNDYNDSDNNNNRECTKQFQFQFCLHVCVYMCVWLAPFSKQLERPQRALSLCFPFSQSPFCSPFLPLSLCLFLTNMHRTLSIGAQPVADTRRQVGAGQAGRVCVAWTAWLNASAWHLLAQRATAALPANYAATCTLFCLFSFLLLLHPSLVGFWCHNCVRDFVRTSRTSIDAFCTIKFWFDAMSCKSVSHVKVAQTTTTLLHVIGIR